MLDNVAAFCGCAPADWTAYFATVPKSIPPKVCAFLLVPPAAHAAEAYTPEAADALWATTLEPLQREGRTEDAHMLIK